MTTLSWVLTEYTAQTCMLDIPHLYAQEWKHANKFIITHWEQGIRLGSPPSTAFIRWQRVLSLHSGRHYSFPNFKRDGNSIKVRSGHNLHKPFKIHRKANIYAGSRVLPTPKPSLSRVLTGYTTKHPCWASQIVLTGVKAGKSLWLRAGDKTQIPPLNSIAYYVPWYWNHMLIL